jgi:Transposase DDE domain group 1
MPNTGRELCSPPTLSPLENAPHLREAIRLSYALIDVWMDSHARAPSAVTRDIDDTVDVANGCQQLSLFNAHYDEHWFLPNHVNSTSRVPRCRPAIRQRT